MLIVNMFGVYCVIVALSQTENGKPIQTAERIPQKQVMLRADKHRRKRRNDRLSDDDLARAMFLGCFQIMDLWTKNDY